MDGGSFGEMNAALRNVGGQMGMGCMLVVPSHRAHCRRSFLYVHSDWRRVGIFVLVLL
jgi:hypothetical protein